MWYYSSLYKVCCMKLVWKLMREPRREQTCSLLGTLDLLNDVSIWQTWFWWSINKICSRFTLTKIIIIYIIYWHFSKEIFLDNSNIFISWALQMKCPFCIVKKTEGKNSFISKKKCNLFKKSIFFQNFHILNWWQNFISRLVS